MIGAILFIYIATRKRCCCVNKQSPFVLASPSILLQSFFINLKIRFRAGYEWIPHIACLITCVPAKCVYRIMTHAFHEISEWQPNVRKNFSHSKMSCVCANFQSNFNHITQLYTFVRITKINNPTALPA